MKETPRTRSRLYGWVLAVVFFFPANGFSFCHLVEVAENPIIRVAMGAPKSIQIQWFGHSTFQITSSKGTRILTDPHQREDLPWPMLPQHIVTTSHNHGAHSNLWMAQGNPVILEGLHPDESWRVIHQTIRDISVYTVPAYHDKSQGWQRGSNSIFVFRVNDICIAHLGDLGHRLTPQQLKMLGKIDVLLIPLAGGMYTITAEEAREVTKQVKPRIAIPMHYWWEEAIATYIHEDFPVKMINGHTLTISKAQLPRSTQIVVLTWTDP